MELEKEIFIDDDQEILDILNFGFPRRNYERADYFTEMDNLSFFRRFRLTKPSVLQVLELIEEELEYDNDLNNSVTPMNQLLTTIRLYASAGHQTSIGDFIGAHQSTVSRIQKKVTNAIARLRPNFIRMPTEHELIEIGTGFYGISKFPKVIGCIDGTHIKIQSPGGDDAEVFRNRKSFFSINTQIICDNRLKIRDIVARWPGSAHDFTIFNNSRIRARMENNEFPNTVLLGDSGYANKNYLLVPPPNPISRAEQLYNEAHIRTRNCIERQIGCWKRRFRVLGYGLRYKVISSCNIIVATAVLHNLAIDNNEAVPPPENLNEEQLDYLIAQGNIEDVLQGENRWGPVAIVNYRQHLINHYFGQL